MKKQNEWFAIINPSSANGRTKNRWPLYYEMIRNAGLYLDFSYTTGPGKGADLAKQAVDAGYTKIIAVGGDGTVNEVINGLIHDDQVRSDDIQLAVLGNGTGSDFVRTYQKSFDVNALIASLIKEQTQIIDIGRVSFRNDAGQIQKRYFINAANVGIGAEAVNRVNSRSKFFGSKITYFTGTIEAIFAYKNMHAALTTDGTLIKEGKVCGLMICNGQYIGGGMRVAPEAGIDDGLFDVIVIKDISKLTLLRRFPLIYEGKHIALPEIDFYRCCELEIETLDSVPVETDGEIVGYNPIKFEIVPKCIKLIVQ